MGNNCCCQKDEPYNRRSNAQVKISRVDNPKRNSYRSVKQQQPEVNNYIDIDQKAIARHGPQNYQSLKYLGRGTFGDVVLAQDKETSKQYAMKIIDKSKIKQVNLMQCKTIKQISDQGILVTIRETFQNQNKIYIIMQYLNKGDIYFYLKKKEFKFTQAIIKSLAAEILHGVQILHNYGIIYRELKPENILVTNQGHIKLTDYGLSKMLVQDKTSTCTFVGALEYMAPQAIKGNYGKQVDLWSIGILIFELIFEKNPFSSLEHTQLAIQNSIETTNIEDILNQKIGLISQDLRDLLIGLLQKNPQKRLSIEEAKKHPFFQGIDWQQIKQRTNHPPLKDFIQKNDHIRFRDPTNEAQISHRVIKYTGGRDGKSQYKANLYEFRNSK